MSREYKGPTVACATCGAEKPPHSTGDYGDGKPRCLQKDGVGGLCWKLREHGPKARGEAFSESAV